MSHLTDDSDLQDLRDSGFSGIAARLVRLELENTTLREQLTQAREEGRKEAVPDALKREIANIKLLIRAIRLSQQCSQQHRSRR